MKNGADPDPKAVIPDPKAVIPDPTLLQTFDPWSHIPCYYPVLSMKTYTQRKAGRGKRPSLFCFFFSWSLALRHRSLASLAFLARLYAKYEAIEEETIN